MAELVSVLGRPTKKKTKSMIPDWTKLPEELLNVILSEKLDNCFEVIHARSVCSPWRSSFPFPPCLVRPSYALPTFPIEKVGLCNLEKIPLFLFRNRAQAQATTSEFFMGEVGKDDPVDYLERSSPLQCSVKAKITRFDSTLMNMVDFQILPLGHQYRMICWNPEGGRIANRIVAFLPLSKEDEFIVLVYYLEALLVLNSAERKWVRLENVPGYECTDLITFRGRFYATFSSGHIFVIDPYSLKATRLLKPLPRCHDLDYTHIVQSGNDELFLVQKSIPDPNVNQSTFRVSKLDEKAGRWIEVSELGDRVLLFGSSVNVCFLAKELPDGCGVSGNSILAIDEPQWGGGPLTPTSFYKYDLNCWKHSSENLVTILNKFPVLSFQVEH